MASRCLALGLLYISGACQAACNLNADSQIDAFVEGKGLNEICAPDAKGRPRAYRIFFERKRSLVILETEQKKVVLEHVRHDQAPSLVDTDSRIQFLPTRLQPYRMRGLLFFMSSRRSVSGAGGGLCGSGSEDYLNVLDVTGRSAKIVAKMQVGSCLDNIELVDISQFNQFRSFWVDADALAMQFLFYDDRCEERLMAKVDISDGKLRFFPSRKDFLN